MVSPRQRSVEVLENLVRARPLAGSNDEVDVATPMPIQQVISDTLRVDPDCAQLVEPRHRCAVILEGADRLPTIKARVVDRDRRLLGQTAEQAKSMHRDERTPRPVGHPRSRERSAGRIAASADERISPEAEGPDADAVSSLLLAVFDGLLIQWLIGADRAAGSEELTRIGMALTDAAQGARHVPAGDAADPRCA
jgi:hypothetical protein